jgi:hypothetical protein
MIGATLTRPDAGIGQRADGAQAARGRRGARLERAGNLGIERGERDRRRARRLAAIGARRSISRSISEDLVISATG